MQSFVYSVFVVVSSVIATLCMVGMGGIIILLILDDTPSGLTGHAPEADRGADLFAKSGHGSRTRPAHSHALRTSP